MSMRSFPSAPLPRAARRTRSTRTTSLAATPSTLVSPSSANRSVQTCVWRLLLARWNSARSAPCRTTSRARAPSKVKASFRWRVLLTRRERTGYRWCTCDAKSSERECTQVRWPLWPPARTSCHELIAVLSFPHPIEFRRILSPSHRVESHSKSTTMATYKSSGRGHLSLFFIPTHHTPSRTKASSFNPIPLKGLTTLGIQQHEHPRGFHFSARLVALCPPGRDERALPKRSRPHHHHHVHRRRLDAAIRGASSRAAAAAAFPVVSVVSDRPGVSFRVQAANLPYHRGGQHHHHHHCGISCASRDLVTRIRLLEQPHGLHGVLELALCRRRRRREGERGGEARRPPFARKPAVVRHRNDDPPRRARAAARPDRRD